MFATVHPNYTVFVYYNKYNNVRSKAVVLLLLSHCLWLLLLFCGVLCMTLILVCCVSQQSRWGKESCLLYFNCISCHLTANALCLFLTLPRIGLQCVFVTITGHTHLLHEILYAI